MVDGNSYDGVVELFLKDNWHKASCAISAYEGGVFISACALGVTRPFTMRMDIVTFVKIADVLRQHLPDEDEGIEDCDEEMDLDDEIFARLDDLSERVGQLQDEHVTPADMQREKDWWNHLAKKVGDLEWRLGKLEKQPVANGRHSGGYYVMEFPGDLVAKLVNS